MDTHGLASHRLGDPLPGRHGTWSVKESLACSTTGEPYYALRVYPALMNLQSTGFALTIGGYFLGHAHKGRQFLPSVHGSFGSLLFIPIISQLFLGIYLKLHIHERTIRPYCVTAHGVLGKLYPILGWIQMLFGAITFRGYCRGGHLGETYASSITHCGFMMFSRSMLGSLYNGKRFHCLRCNYGSIIACR